MMKREKQITGVTIGADPEFFIYSELEEKFIPSIGLIGGNKNYPTMITSEGHAIQEDNVMVEYCVPPACTSEEFIKNINFVKEYINETILQKLGYVPKYIASARFDLDDLDHRQAREFGCMPDYNAWLEGKCNVFAKPADSSLRTAGGHIHIGYDNPDAQTTIDIIKAMDLVLGLQSLILDTDTERRVMYGKAGAFRFKPYGGEYRVLSTFWTANDDLIKWAFDNTHTAIKMVNDGLIITNPDEIVNCINDCNKDLALELLSDYNVEVLEYGKERVG